LQNKITTIEQSVIKKKFDSFFNLSGDVKNDESIHYPVDDFIDINSGSQCFFHRHKSSEIGVTQHFHFFRNWFPPSIQGIDNSMMTTHIAALEVNESFKPISWFTLNQWVTGSYFLLYENLKMLCHNFNFNSIKNNRNTDVLHWLELNFKDGAGNYFDDLIKIRDKKLESIYKSGTTNILENKDYEVISRIFI
jgi:hypothetical protein